MIYSFRGSDINAFFTFVEKHNLKQYKLERNYRSTQTIVNAANSVIKHNEKQFDKDLYSKKQEGGSVVVFNTSDQASEAALATKIATVLNRTQGIAYKDMAVLFRMSYLSRPIEDSFLSNGVPYVLLSGTPFYSREEVKDVVSYLTLLVNPMNMTALKRIINVPKRGVGDKSVEKLISSLQLRGSDVIMTLEDVLEELERVASEELKGKAKSGVQAFVALMHQLNDAMPVSKPADMVDIVRGMTNYDDYLLHKDEASYDDRAANLDELHELAITSASLYDFVTGLVLAEETSNKKETAEGVNLVTIHGSKGLEYKVVIVIGLNEGILPHYRAIMTGDTDEERRLFYVAMTRAKDYLFITRPNFMMQNGTPVAQRPSSFLAEIDERYVKQR